ncbi:3-hydroxyacyl-CoA dehydrogenase family protein [Bacillus seohaeanensis]|uniref:3-hydroxyacyl-CoA dehydrogenase family protein n=1 Tax=Bacillus seohaeanensis TaxID=284580 RepID=A0ABW5RVL7_9BACI
MRTESIQHITVVGAGQMGHQIAMLCAIGGYETVIQDLSQGALHDAKQKLETIMSRWERKGKLTKAAIEAAFGRLTFTTDLREAVKETDFVIEAIVEKLDVKRELFKQLDELANPNVIFASNSSTIVNSLIAEVTNRKENVVNMHFFFPPLVMDCVEVVKSDATSDETARLTMEVCEKINRTAVLLNKEISGFIANRILGALQREAVYLYENGYASFEDIDLICKKALSHPIGPFELMDLSGIDVVNFVMRQRFEETGDPNDKPAKCVEERVNKGDLGRKTGRGFYEYAKEGVKG